MSSIDKLIEQNHNWADQVEKEQPGFFEALVAVQKPEILWIGCADSRIPANQVIGLPPGEVFVHRNLANVVVASDLNCLSVLQYAVEILKVNQVVVCGHYGCGGVQAALATESHGLIDNWLRHIRVVKRLHEREFDHLEDEQSRWDRLCELNVIEQVHNVCATTIVQEAWLAGSEVTVHGWIYDLHNGKIENLCSRNRDTAGQQPDTDGRGLINRT